ncbi:MAG: H-NS histone family protein [Flavimaricola sp.]|nr:H-NS histone family protein [Flavimaricola sp.]
MTIDLNAMSRKELTTLAANVEKAIASLSDREKKAALEAAERAAAEHGYSLAELAAIGGKGAKRGKAKTPAKYRNPENPDQTWSGRGRKPGWINAAESAGRSIADFAI